MKLRVPAGSLVVLMSPKTVVMVRLPFATEYFVASSRTIEFQRVLSSDVPPNSSPGCALGGSGDSTVTQSNLPSTLVAAAFERAKMPIFAFAGRAAERPTAVHVVPSIEY